MIGDAMRVDAPLKTRGRARYAAEFAQAGMLHAALVPATIVRGRLAVIETGQARSLAGVADVVTGEAGGLAARLLPERLCFQGQPIAVVVADTPEIARHAASLVRARYKHADGAVIDMARALDRAYAPSGDDGPANVARGEADAFASAPVRIEAVYETSQQFHNPMEPHATVARWDGGVLTVWTATQGVGAARDALARSFGLDRGSVRVICPYVGGGFGCKGETWPPALLAALAAQRVGRPVRLEITREEMYANNGYRPRTHQTVGLGAGRDGRLVAIRHDGISQMSDPSLGEFVETVTDTTRMLYACGNVATTQRLVATGFGLPTYMRAPGEATGMFALESAMDELAHALAMDPIELRRRNHADHDGESGLPFSSKHLLDAYREGAHRFGWRAMKPGAMRDGHVLVGWGMATATYPAYRAPASAQVIVHADGTALVRSGTQDLGTGTYTLMAQVAADELGLPMARVRVELGDTGLPDAPTSGGSITAASVTPAVRMAARSVRARLAGMAVATGGAEWRGLSPEELRFVDGRIVGPAGSVAIEAVLARARQPMIEAEAGAQPGEARVSMHSFGAQFAEVRVDPDFGTVRVSRFVGVYDAGRVLNVRTARSQLLGGIVFGIGQALQEAAVPDLATGRLVNANLSDYLLPVNADVPAIEVATVGTPDLAVDPLGARGMGELPIVGVAAAIANAVFNATGRRVRRLPIRVEDLLA